MSPRFRNDPFAGDHGRARELAALRVDEPLSGTDAAWLEAHLAGCAECATAAASYDDTRLLFAALRDQPLDPPRDLWARTSAAIDAEAGTRSRGASGTRYGRSHLLAPLAAVAVVAIVVGAAFLNGSLIPSGPGPGTAVGPVTDATPIALTAGNVSVLSQNQDGSLEIQTQQVNEVCPVESAVCHTQQNVQSQPLMGVSGTRPAEAILSPDRERVVLVERGEGARGVYVVPVGAVAAMATLPPTAAPTTAAPTTAAPTTAAPTTAAPTTAATTTPTTAPTPDETVIPTEAPTDAVASSTASPDAQPTASATTPPETAAPTPAETPPPATDAPATVAPTPTLGVTPLPGGAIKIASDVIVVGAAPAYDSNGRHLAFSARPADGSAGPDVYVWIPTDKVARPVTSDNGSVFNGWHDGHLLVSRVRNGKPATYLVDPASGADVGGKVGNGWRPTLGPGNATAAWWDGTVILADDGVTQVPGDGNLVLGPWEGSGRTQVLYKGPMNDWQVRWSPDGSVIALWIAGPKADQPGRLSLYRIDPDTGRVRLGDPLLRDEPAFDGFSVQNGQLAWATPAAGRKTAVWVLAWDDSKVIGSVQLPADSGSTVIR